MKRLFNLRPSVYVLLTLLLALPLLNSCRQSEESDDAEDASEHVPSDSELLVPGGSVPVERDLLSAIRG